MSRKYCWAGCLIVTLVLGNTGLNYAQGTPPILWAIQAHASSIENVSFSADGQTVVSGSGNEAKAWRATDGAPLSTYSGHADGVVSTDISPSGELLAVGYIVSGYPPGGVMKLWDMNSQTVLAEHGGCYVAFSPDGSLIASGGGGVNRYVNIHRVYDHELVDSYYNGPGYITDVAFSPDRGLLAVSRTDNTIRLWELASGTIIRTLSGHTDDVSCLAFSPDGQFLVAGAGGWDTPSDSTIKLWRVSDGELLRTFPGHGVWVNTVDFSPSGQVITSGGRDSSAPLTYSLRFWRVSDGELLRYYDELTHDIAYSPSDQYYCFGRIDGTLVLASETLTSVSDEEHGGTPGAVRLKQNNPNPFNPHTTIGFDLTASRHTKLTVYSLDGKPVITLLDLPLSAGHHAVNWNGLDGQGRSVASGSYFYRLDAETSSVTKRMMLIR